MNNIFLFIIAINLILLINFVKLTPLSQCTKGRIAPYYNWKNGGSCGFGPHTNAIGATYIYPVAPNQDLFGESAQCGVCYEMVGPIGAIKVRVEDYCAKNSESGYCSGDMFHFNVANNSVSYIMGNSNLANITFRMVSCDYTGNVKILTDKNTNYYYISFVVLDHNIAVSHVQIQEYNSETWNNITRNQNNNWVYYNINTGLNFPITLRIYSINGDYLSLTLNNIEANKYYDFDTNFYAPDDNTLFSISNLKKITVPSGYNKTKCCERDKSDFSPIYKDGVVNGGYKISNSSSTIIYNSDDIYLDKYSLNIKFNSNGVLSFVPYFPIRADQYRGISFRIKSIKFCNNLNLKFLNKVSTVETSLKISESYNWQSKIYNFDNSVTSNNEFNGIQFEVDMISNCEVNVEDIHLIQNPSAPDAGICYANSTSNSVSSQDIITNEPIEDIDISNHIIINNIIINENAKNVLNVNCNRFSNSDNKKINLILTSKNNNNTNYIIDNCTSSNTYINAITSFTCTFPGNIPDGLYKINQSSTDGLNFFFAKEIEIKNGLIIVGNVDNTMNKFSDVYYSPLIIINSKEQVINKGDIISFNVYPIPQENYYLENDEIILLNTNNYLSLRLKYCYPNSKNKIIYSVSCTVNNNMKGNFTKIYSEQTVSLLDGQTLNLISNNPSGGMILKSFNHVVNSTMTKAQKNSYSLTFDVLYYDSNVRPMSEFPHKIYLFGIKRYTNKRLLDTQENYDSRINLKNCTAGDYSTEDSSAIGWVKCLLPDFVSAGTYNKLDCDGIDMNPSYSLMLILNRDFNRSSGNDLLEDTIISNGTISKSSSSGKSKDWIIWIIVAILVIILAGLVIIILASRKKNDGENTTKKDSDSSAAKNNNESS